MKEKKPHRLRRPTCIVSPLSTGRILSDPLNFLLKPPQIIDAFDATKHPAVVSGCQAPDLVSRDFVDGFVAGFPPDRRASGTQGRLV